MEPEILAIAIVRPFDDRAHDVLALLNEFYAMLARKGYSRDILYRSHKDPSRFFNLRYWKSDEMRREAKKIPMCIVTGTNSVPWEKWKPSTNSWKNSPSRRQGGRAQRCECR